MIKKAIILLAVATLSLCDLVAQTTPQWPEVRREARPGSRWWWMGSAVDAANLQWTISQYAQAGMGTLEITPIYGVTGNEKNELSYLGEGWLQALKICQQAGEQQGVDIDMNGGTGWPFGGPTVKIADAAGKLVTKNATLDADGTTALTFDVTAPESHATLNKVMAYQQDGDQQVVDITAMVSDKTLSWTAPQGRWLLLAVYNGHTLQQVKRAAPGGEGYVLDHYDAGAVSRYLSRFDTQFAQYGAQWPHSFFNDSYEVYGADWTPLMFEQFEQRRGYKLEEHMDQLLALGKRKDTDNQVLSDYRQTLSDMLLDNFTRQWTAWAHQHGATTRNQSHGSPGNLLDIYGAVDIPEIESFGLSDFQIRGLRQDPGFTAQNLSDLATLKYASSAAHVMGRQLTSSETFTWLAEHFRVSLSQMKPDLDFFFLAGVNHIFFHGTTYSPQDAPWPGWKFYASIDMSPTNPIWRDAPALMDYATRCQSFLQMGQPDNDVLVYAPFQDAMHKNTGANQARLQLFDINTLSQKIPSIPTTVRNIESAGLDCDYISDAQLLQTRYENGCLTTEGGTRYKALVVPVTAHMPADVAAHLEQLEAQGAKIIRQNTVAAISALGLQGEALRTQLGLRVLRRQNATGHHYFITNLSKNNVSGRVPLAVSFQGAVLFDPMTGRMRQASVRDGQVWIALKSGQSVILQTYDTPVELAEKDEPLTESQGVAISGPWTLSFTADTWPAELGTFTLPQTATWESLNSQTAQAMGTGVYEMTFDLSAQLFAMGNGGFRLDLGDVRESARVYINNVYAGCVWSAPFVVDATGLLHQGTNTLRIEVTNLPANRISQMDRDGIAWRKFKDVNILDIVNGSTSVANVTYQDWAPVPSGLNSTVRLVPLRRQSAELQLQLTGFETEDDGCYPVYRLTMPSATAPVSVSLTKADGSPYTGYQLSDTNDRLTLRSQADGYVVVRATDADGAVCEAYVQALGAYDQVRAIDFTADTPPDCGWMTLASQSEIKGFSGTGKLPWCRATANGKEVTTLYEGLTFRCDRSTYYFFFPGYGMNCNYDFTVTLGAQPYDQCLLSYLQGDGASVYNAADSLVSATVCAEGDSLVTLELQANTAFVVYRSLQQYRPRQAPAAVTVPTAVPAAVPSVWYTLQGQPVTSPRRGLYIRNGRKVLVR